MVLFIYFLQKLVKRYCYCSRAMVKPSIWWMSVVRQQVSSHRLTSQHFPLGWNTKTISVLSSCLEYKNNLVKNQCMTPNTNTVL